MRHNFSGIVRRVEDLLDHAMGKQVYVFLGDPEMPDYRRPYHHIGRGEFAWAYEDARDGYTIHDLLMTWYPADLVFVEAGYVTYTDDEVIYKPVLSNI